MVNRLSKSFVNNLLEVAMSTGGDFAELFFESTTSNLLAMVNGVLEQAVTGVISGVGLRVFVGNNAVYVYTNDTTESGLLKLANSACSAVNKGAGVGRVLPFVEEVAKNNHKILRLPKDIVKADVVDVLRLAHEKQKATDVLITETSNQWFDSTQEVTIINSEGLWVTDNRVRSRINFSSIASKGGEKQSGGHNKGARLGFEILETIDVEEMAKASAISAVTMINAGFAPSGEMPVVIGNGFGGVIFHEACGHSFEASFVAKGASTFAGRMGQQVASPLVTLVDDGTIENGWGSLNVDDEGNKTQKNVLIENGVLKSYLVDRLNGQKMGATSTGSCRRENYKYAPTSRMNNTYLENGKSTPEEIISNTEYGLYAMRMGGGSVMPATGDFNFAVFEGYMIRNGKIAEPVRGASLIGKGHEVLMDIDMVGNDIDHASGMCGASSGSIPTNIGQPTLRVSKITVGGRQ